MIARVFGGLRRRPGSAAIPEDALNTRSEAGSSFDATEAAEPELDAVRLLLDSARPDEALGLALGLTSRFNQSVSAHCLLGQALLACGEAEQALQTFTDAITLQADHIESLVGQAKAFRRTGATEDAVDSLEIALAHDPRSLGALLELAAVWEETGAWQATAPLLERALEVDRARSDLWVRLAAARDGCEQFDSAATACENALKIDPDCIAAWVNLGMLQLERFGNPHSAEGSFREALARDPACHAALANLGLALQEQGRFQEALALYEVAIMRVPGFSELRWNRGLARLMQGDYAHGWLDYEVRFDRADGRGRRTFPFAPWQGETQIDGALLVYAEQGLGDEIMFASCLPDLVQRRMNIVLECNPRLSSLFQRSFPAIQVRGEPRGSDRAWLREHPALSRQIAVGSLPAHLRQSRGQFPQHRGYLVAEPRRIAKWRDCLASLGSGMAVGLGWRAGTAKTRRTQKSISLDALVPFLNLPGVRYVCLQHDLRDDERCLLEHHQVAVWQEPLGDVDEMAALISALDLTVTVASTNAHLAGALGRPVWILLGASPEWRWLWEGECTPWYPTARLWRQERSGDWQSAVGRLHLALAAMAAERRWPATTAERA